MSEPTRVLFVCTGNICRSPMAEALFRHLVAARGLQNHILTASRGTGSWHVGEPPHRGTRQVLSARHIAWDGQQAQQLTPRDLETYDWILVMDGDNLNEVQAMRPPRPHRVKRVLDWHPDAVSRDVPDPYYTGRFEEVYNLLLPALTRFLDTISPPDALRQAPPDQAGQCADC